MVNFRSMLENPLNSDNMDFDVNVTEFPDDDLEWEEIPLANFDAFRQQRNLPILNVDTVKAFNNLS